MAESADQLAADILQKEGLLPASHCNVCLKAFAQISQTALLSCGHTVCQPCAEQELKERGQLQCPVCHNVDQQPALAKVDGGPTTFWPNIFLSDRRATEALCAKCSDEGIDPKDSLPAIACCTTCKINLCEVHEPVHQRFFSAKGHTITPTADAVQKIIETCQRHQEPIKAYCITCSTAVCFACSLDDHPNPKHTVAILGTHAPSLIKQLSEAAKGGLAIRQTVTNNMKNYPAARRALEARQMQIKQQIQQSFASLHQLLTDREKELLAENSRAGDEELAELEVALCRAHRRWLALHATSLVTDRLLAPGTKTEHLARYSARAVTFFATDGAKPVEPLPLMRETTFSLSEHLVESLKAVGNLALGQAYGPSCTATGKGLSSAFSDDLGLDNQFVLVLRDRRKHLVTGKDDRIDVTATSIDSGAVMDLKIDIKRGSNGAHTVKYQVEEAGRVTLTVRVNGEPVQGSPFTVKVVEGVLFSYGGPQYDNCGILYHLGTACGEQAWRNPHQAGVVKVTTSASDNGAYYTSSIASNNGADFFVNNCHDHNAIYRRDCNWIVLDLKNHRIRATAFMLSFGSQMSAWLLEASEDGQTWTSLKEQEQVEDWNSSQHALTSLFNLDEPSQPVRFFRVRQKNAEAQKNGRRGGPVYHNQLGLQCCGFELYGWLL